MTANDPPRDQLEALLDAARLDDEISTLDEEAGVAEARREYERGDVFQPDQLKRAFG